MAPLNNSIGCFRLLKEEIEGKKQCCGSGIVSGSGLDLDSMGSLDPYPDSQSGSRSKRAIMPHKNRKKLINLIF
jgi:hypothetical protein